MANTPYISPIRLLEHCHIAFGEQPNVSRIRKQLIAEFSLDATGVIAVGKYHYNKTDIVAELDSGDFAERLQVHISVWHRKNLLHFLELGTLDTDELRSEMQALKKDTAFITYCSSSIATAFNYFTRQLLTVPDFDEIKDLFFLEQFISVTDKETAFRSLRMFFDEQTQLLKNTYDASFKLMRPKIKHWWNKRWIGCINNLPAEFYNQRNNIVYYLINVTVAIHNKHPQKCYRISRQLIRVKDLSQESAKLVKHNHRAYRASAEQLVSYMILESPRAYKQVKKLCSILTKKIRRLFKTAPTGLTTATPNKN